ncbi:MAG: pentapeptide repeat-containing protein [Acidobacteriota bacterium]
MTKVVRAAAGLGALVFVYVAIVTMPEPTLSRHRDALAVVGGVAVLVGLFVVWRRSEAALRSAKAAEAGQITGRYTEAIKQLGDDHPAVRLGGVYALEKISQDDPERYDATVMDVLCAYLRDHRRGESDGFQTPTEVQAVLDVLRRRDRGSGPAGVHIDLRGADLSGADLANVELPGANLSNVDLSGANLSDADFSHVDLSDADLSDANLSDANLVHANLSGADFTNANLSSADLSGSYLSDANLRGADLSDADLSNVECSGTNFSGANLSNADLSGAYLDHADLTDTIVKQPR